MKRWMLLLACLFVFWAAQAQAQVIWRDDGGHVQVVSTSIGEEEWLFLPSGTDLSSLLLSSNGQTSRIDWLAVSQTAQERPNVYSGVLELTGEMLHVAVSDKVRSLHLQSEDPQLYGREWLEDSANHQKETTGRIVILGTNGKLELKQNLLQLRGRGNSTWNDAANKKPYQFKLEYRADVLNTGVAEEAARTWVLLSNEQDYSKTMLRNQLGLDIAKEMGLTQSSRCEQVDLYYDGDYRGTYLLAEKVEVGSHSVDVRNFDKMLERVNLRAGNPIPNELPSPTDFGGKPPVPKGYTPKHGAEYGYAEGVYDNRDVAAGGYLLELNHFGLLREQAWFKLPSEMYVSVKNPEYAGDKMMQYVADKFIDAYQAMMNYGYHPETDEPLEHFIDIESFVLSHLASELIYTSNSYFFSSTYFVLPEGEERFYAGPIWDLDHHTRHPLITWPALRDSNEFSHAFYRTTVFQRAAQKVMAEVVAPIYEKILFGDLNGKYLLPFETYKETLRASWYMNAYRFAQDAQEASTVEMAFERCTEEIRSFLQVQHDYLQEEIAKWSGDEVTTELELECVLPYGAAEKESYVKVIGKEPYVSLYLKNAGFVCVEPATEEDYAVWEMTLEFIVKPHAEAADEVTIIINGEPFLCESDDGKVILTLQFEDPSYRPAVLDGVDYGHVFDYEYYIDSYPELLDEYGEDREEVLRYFVEEGMDLGDCAAEFFDPMMVFEYVPEAAQMYEVDWRLYYEAFMETPGIWMRKTDSVYEPEFFQP